MFRLSRCVQPTEGAPVRWFSLTALTWTVLPRSPLQGAPLRVCLAGRAALREDRSVSISQQRVHMRAGAAGGGGGGGGGGVTGTPALFMSSVTHWHLMQQLYYFIHRQYVNFTHSVLDETDQSVFLWVVLFSESVPAGVFGITMTRLRFKTQMLETHLLQNLRITFRADLCRLCAAVARYHRTVRRAEQNPQPHG